MGMLEALLDPKRRAKAKADQEKRRELSGHLVARHPAIATFRHGVARERAAWSRADLDTDSASLTVQQIAEGYAMQARFGEAAALTIDPVLKAERRAMAQAVENVGIKQCQCPLRYLERQRGNAKGVRVDALNKILQVAIEGTTIVDIVRCHVCKTLSAFYE